MKYAIIIPDGCADEPQDSLGGKTPLQAANTPAMDEIARLGVVGRSNNVPAHLPPGSDVANLSLFGYDPNKYFTGRAPLEAAAQGIKLGAGRLGDPLQPGDDRKPDDAELHRRSHFDSRSDRAAARPARRNSAASDLEFIPGVSYRNLLLYRGAKQAAPVHAATRGPRRRTT